MFGAGVPIIWNLINAGVGGSQVPVDPLTVVVSTSAASPIYDTYTVTIIFSETVTGFVSAGITAAGTVSNFSTLDNITFTATITPIAPGLINVSVAQGVASAVSTGAQNDGSNILSTTVYITTALFDFNGSTIYVSSAYLFKTYQKNAYTNKSQLSKIYAYNNFT